MCRVSCLRIIGLWILARRMRKVFLSSDALGLLADFFRARRDFAVAWTNAHEKIAGHAPSHRDGTAHPLRLNHSLSMVCRRGGGMACLGARFHGLPAWFDDP